MPTLTLALLLCCMGSPRVAVAQLTPEVSAHFDRLAALSEEALSAAQAAQQARSLTDLRTQVDRVVTTIWGLPSGLADQPGGAAAMHGWKTQWQVTYSDFDPAYAERYGSAPPAQTDIMSLGMVGVGRSLRKALVAQAASETTPAVDKQHLDGMVASLNNVIGWMRMDDGVTKAERQPRVDLTYQWDAPSEFWNTSADTGWIFEVQAQALNILKTPYDDLAEAKPHVDGLVALVQKSRQGLDADSDGTIEPTMMEGGLLTMIAQARAAGLY